MRLSLRLLCRGSAWFDPSPGVVIRERTSEERTRALERWPNTLTFADQLGLFEDRGQATVALAAHTRRVASDVRVALGTGPTEQTVNAIQRVAVLWRGEDTIEVPGTAQLRLHAVVSLSSGEHDRTTIAAAKALARRVTVIGPGAEDHAAAFDLAEGLPSTSAEDARRLIAHVAAQSVLPVLMMHGGELPRVADQHQMIGFLAEPSWSEASICTPLGWETRLWRGGHSMREPSRTGELGGAEGVDGDNLHVVHSVELISVGTDGVSDWWLQGEQVGAQPHHLRRFVIAAPDYTDNHGGVVAMHRLCDRLNRIGYEAYIEPLGEATGETRPGWRTPLWWRRDFDDTVMIYPEIVTGNPLGAARVVRWLLNRPNWFTGSEMDEDGTDLIVAFSPQIAPTKPVLALPLVDPTIFFPKDLAGVGRLLWIGKGTVPPDFDRSDVTLITNTWPSTRPAMANLLRRAEVLYTCDWLTTIIGESLMCGTPVVMVGEQIWGRDDVVMWPGMAWEHDGDLDHARKEAAKFADAYRSAVGWADHTVEQFVQLVNDHFLDHALIPATSWPSSPTVPSSFARLTAGLDRQQ